MIRIDALWLATAPIDMRMGTKRLLWVLGLWVYQGRLCYSLRGRWHHLKGGPLSKCPRRGQKLPSGGRKFGARRVHDRLRTQGLGRAR